MPTSAAKPMADATFLEVAAVAALQGSIARDGELSPEVHADYAIQAAEALIVRLAKRGDA